MQAWLGGFDFVHDSQGKRQHSESGICGSEYLHVCNVSNLNVGLWTLWVPMLC
uniref:Uncharacterized protein n=1 Tax=Manihot esculenta TaxID=3983 RepID=A0A2C9UCL8_MANES